MSKENIKSKSSDKNQLSGKASDRNLAKSVSFNSSPPSMYSARSIHDLGEEPVTNRTPKDKHHYVYAAMILFGVGALTPWNSFITAKDYFVKVKLANEPQYANNFLTYLGVASQVPNVALNWINIFVRLKSGLKSRIIVSLTIIILLFFVTVVLAYVDTSQHTGMFFWVTLFSVAVMQSFNAIYQSSIYGTAAKLPARYPGAIVLGSNFCGTIVVLLDWITDTVASASTAAQIFFLMGKILIIICLIVFFLLPKNEFYNFHNYPELERDISSVAVNVGVTYIYVLKQCAEQLYNVYITFFLTLSIFPNVHSDIKSTSSDSWLGKEFTRVTCFLTFNLFALIGSITATFWQIPGPNYLRHFTTARLMFIPIFLFCNYEPRGSTRQKPVIINNDYVYWFAAIIFSWSAGHANTLGVIYVRGEGVKIGHATLAGMFASAFIVTGILSGIIFSGVLQKLF